MESWRKVWREGVAPLLSREQLERLRSGLELDDPKLIQGATTTPPPLMCVQDWPCEAGCALAYCAMNGGRPEEELTVGEVEEFFARMCYEIDQRVGEPAGCRWFLNWFDETDRNEMRYLLLEEVRLSLHVA